MSSLLPLSNNRGTGGIRFKTLVQPGAIISPLVLTRSQLTGVQSTAIASDGSTVQTYGADVARFNGSARRLLIEGQRTNEMTNPNVFTTGWSQIFSGTGATAPVLTPNAGIAPDGSTTATRLQADAGSSGFSGLTIGVSTSGCRAIYARSLTGGNLTLQIGTSSTTTVNQRTVTPTWQRIIAPTTNDGVHRVLALSSVAGNSRIVDMLIWGASSEANAAFPSSLILPPTGSPGSSTRGADTSINTPLSRFGINSSGACTILMSAMFPFGTAITGATALLSISDGTNNNRLYVRSGGANIIAINNVAGGVTPSVVGSANLWTPGTVFRLGIVALGNGTVKVVLNNGAIISQAGGPTSGLTTLRIGSDATGGTPMFGEIHTLKILPYALPDAALTAYVAALPV
jgi:hypothetical protein